MRCQKTPRIISMSIHTNDKKNEREHGLLTWYEQKDSTKITKIFRKEVAQNKKRHYLCNANEDRQGHSPAGLERCSHIAEVIGSNPIVPTSKAN